MYHLKLKVRQIYWMLICIAAIKINEMKYSIENTYIVTIETLLLTQDQQSQDQ